MKKLLFILLLFVVGTIEAQVVFQKTFGGIDADYGNSVQQTTDGGYIISGQTESFGIGNDNIYLVKTDANGDTLWARTFEGINWGEYMSVQQTIDGGYIVLGCTNGFGAGALDLLLIKTDVDGDTLWTKTFGGGSGDIGQFVQQTTDGGYILTGFTASFGAGGRDVYLVKTDSIGNLLWTRTYGGALDEEGFCVKQTTNGGYIIAGYTESFGAGLRDFYLVNTDANGDMLWTKTFGGTSTDWGFSVLQANDGGYVMLGWTANFGAGPTDFYLIKTDSNGDTLWTKTYGGTFSELGYSVLQTTNGELILIGMSNSFGGGGYDVYMIKTNATGDTLWTKAYGSINTDLGRCVQPTNDGGYIILGRTTSFGVGSDIYLIKTDAWGNSGGCNEYNTNTIVSSTATEVGSGGVVDSGGVVNNTATIISSAPMVDTVLCLGVGVEEQLAIKYEQITVYPNPTEGKFRVTSLEFGVEEIEVYDLFGRLLLRSNKHEIDMSNYPAGLYIWSVGEARGKVIIE